MGRTVPPFRNALEEAIKKWDGYRRALRLEERNAFDRMMDACRLHSSASGQAVRPEPLEPMLISILLEHQRRLEALDAELDRILRGMKRE
jgi:hypothetical protein